jgi:hypothetical protein
LKNKIPLFPSSFLSSHSFPIRILLSQRYDEQSTTAASSTSAPFLHNFKLAQSCPPPTSFVLRIVTFNLSSSLSR